MSQRSSSVKLNVVLVALAIGLLAVGAYVFWTANGSSGLILILGITIFWGGASALAGLVLALRRFREFDRVFALDLSPAVARAKTEVLAREQQRRVAELLRAAALDVASEQRTPAEFIRAAVFRMDTDGLLRIVPGFTFQMASPDELQIEIRPGEGGAGTSFASRQPCISILLNPVDDSTISQEKQRFRIDPDLRWIVSVPIFAGSRETPIGVLNVDGLSLQKDAEDLAQSIPTLIRWAELLSVFLREAQVANDVEQLK